MHRKGMKKSMKKFTGFALLLLVLCLVFTTAMAEESPTGDPSNLKDWSKWEPKIETKANGVRVQTVPDSAEAAWPWSFSANWKYYNTYYLNAENRGCQACHKLQDVLKSIGHCIYEGSYPTTDDISYNTCIGCHSLTYSGMNLMQPMHQLHQRSAAFKAMGGSCESCHYITYDGKYERWDLVKYDVLKGITDVAASDLDITVEWNQTEITPNEYVFGSKWNNAFGWGLTEADDIQYGYTFDYINQFVEDDYLNNYKVHFSGDIEQGGADYSIQELIDLCGTETRTFVTQCTINGIGCDFVYQTEMTGIPMEKIYELVGVKDFENSVCYPLGYDGYYYNMTLENSVKEHAMLVYQMNGEPLTLQEGFPLMFQAEHISAGNKTRTVVEISIVSGDEAYEYYGDFTDDYTGYLICKPNIGVLSAFNGQIFTPGEPVHLEGYASAFEEPIAKIEFSLDHGETWTEVETTGADAERWVYWKIDLNNLEKGAYCLSMRATSIDDETGDFRVNQEIPKFLINVKD